jgi:flagellar basal body-associated protein FliL
MRANQPPHNLQENLMNILIIIVPVIVCAVMALVIFLNSKVKARRLYKANLRAVRSNGEYDGRQTLALVEEQGYDDYEYTLSLAHKVYAGTELGEAYYAGFKSAVDAGFKNTSGAFF